MGRFLTEPPGEPITTAKGGRPGDRLGRDDRDGGGGGGEDAFVGLVGRRLFETCNFESHRPGWVGAIHPLGADQQQASRWSVPSRRKHRSITRSTTTPPVATRRIS